MLYTCYLESTQHALHYVIISQKEGIFYLDGFVQVSYQ